MWMVIRTPPHGMAIARAQLCCMSHLGTNYTVRMWLGPPIHFIHMYGKHHTYKRCLAYFIWCGWSLGCHPGLYGHGQGLALCHIWELTTVLGCDWDLLSTSYTCQVHFIHIKGVWHTLYAVDGHKDATPTCMATVRARWYKPAKPLDLDS